MRYDPSHPAVGRYEIVVRDSKEPELAVQSATLPDSSVGHGIGHLQAGVYARIQDRLRLDRYRSEHVATVTVDMDLAEYHIRWEVHPPLSQRFADLLDELAAPVTGGGQRA